MGELPAWYDRSQPEPAWWRRLAESRPVRVLFWIVAVPWFLLEAAFAVVAFGGLVWAAYIAVRHAPIFLLVFPPAWFVAWYVAKWTFLLTWEGLACVWEGAPGWWRSWRVARGSRVASM